MVKVNLLERSYLYEALDRYISLQTFQQYLKVKPKYLLVQFISKMQSPNLIKIALTFGKDLIVLQQTLQIIYNH